MYHLLKETKVSFKSFLFYIEYKLVQRCFFQKFGPIYHKFKKHEDAQPDKK
jgi:hypothetical protein